MCISLKHYFSHFKKFLQNTKFKRRLRLGWLYKFYYKVFYFVENTAFYALFFAPEYKYIFHRIVFGYIYGLVLGFLFWDIFISNIGLSVKSTYILLCISMVSIGIGCAFLMKIRCVCLLTCLGFCGRTGRSIMKAVIMALVLTGPINNIVLNSGEVVRTFTCSTVLTYKLSQTRFNLMTKPFHNALMGMKRNISHIKDSLNTIEDVVQPIVDEVEGEDSVNETYDKREIFLGFRSLNLTNRKRSSADKNNNEEQLYQQNYLNKLEKRCELQIEKGAGQCRAAFEQAHQKCWDKLPPVIRSILCWPMKVDFVCNIASSLGVGKGKSGPCNPENAIDPALGKNYNNLRVTENLLVGNFSNVTINYKLIEPKEVPGLKSAEETGRAINAEFKTKKTTFDRCMFVIKRILAFVFIKLVIGAFGYQKRYVSNIEFDNIYVTAYFKKIDERRKTKRKPHLLPLKKVEQANVVDPISSRRIKVEFSGMVMHIVKLILEILTATCFVLLDSLFYEALDLVRRHALIEFTQQGFHDVTITVNGTGIIAAMVRSAISGFTTAETINTTTTNKHCLPNPSKLSNWFLFKIYGTYFLVFVLIYNEIYIQRMRRLFCSYFYPKREKKRVLYLYNKLLHRRTKLFKFLSGNVKEKIKQRKLEPATNLFIKLRFRYKKYFSWLIILPFARRRCLICNEREPIKRDFSRPFHFAECATPGCEYVHCEECWFDIGEVCLPCQKFSGDYASDGFESDFNKSDWGD